MIGNLQVYFDTQTDEMVAGLRRLVEMESPSRDKAKMDALGAVMAQELRELGATVTVDEQPEMGDHIIGRWPGPATRQQHLILCHLDTVWPLGTLAERPVRVKDGRFYGPGSYDMKAGVVIALAALRSLWKEGRVEEKTVVQAVKDFGIDPDKRNPLRD